jgi:hypothetical protein
MLIVYFSITILHYKISAFNVWISAFSIGCYFEDAVENRSSNVLRL